LPSSCVQKIQKKKFAGGVLIHDLMMVVAKATYYQEWEAKMEEMKMLVQTCI